MGDFWCLIRVWCLFVWAESLYMQIHIRRQKLYIGNIFFFIFIYIYYYYLYIFIYILYLIGLSREVLSAGL